MSKNTRVLNLTRGFSLRFNQASRAVEECACVWVDFGVSIRDVTLAESIQLRNKQAARREPMAHVELPGIVYEPCASAAEGFRRERRLAGLANSFAERAVALAG
jgi:hypothetical protein